MKKNFLYLLLCILFSGAVLAGCTSKSKTVDNVNSGNKPTDAASTTDNTILDDDKPEEPKEGVKTIAVSLPDQSSRWESDGTNMKQGLEALGYTIEIKYAQNDSKLQAAQIKEFVQAGADCIVMAAVDAEKAKKAGAAAQEAGIPLIAYDSLPMGTGGVSFYTAFDHKGMGNQIGKAVVEKAGLDDLPEGTYKTIEFFMGPKEDKNASYIYLGLMEVLRPYLDNGTLVCNTGRTSFEDTSIAEWSQDTAKRWCENYLEGYYNAEDLDICVTAYDGFAYGCKAAFMAAGYTQDNWPVISGIGCEPLACKNILEKTQSFSICTDSRVLAAECVEVVDAVMNGMEPDVNNAELYDNGVMTVPAHLCTALAVDEDNLEEIIVDGGYYTREEIDGA